MASPAFDGDCQASIGPSRHLYRISRSRVNAYPSSLDPGAPTPLAITAPGAGAVAYLILSVLESDWGAAELACQRLMPVRAWDRGGA